MIRILQCVNDMHRAGLETMLMNYYRNIDRTQIQFDFLTHRPYRSDYDDEIESLGGKVYYAPRLYPQNYPAYFKWMAKFFFEHPEYEIVHSHIDTMSYLPLLAAKKAGVPIRIAHSHNTAVDRDFKHLLKQYFRLRINSVCNQRLACGQEAGKFLFGNRDFKVIPNAIDAEKFYFNKVNRKKKREELGLTTEFVVGHVGRFSYQKNHKFLVEIFNELLKKEPSSILLLVGIGEKEDEVREQIKTLGITDKVRFLGNRSDVNELYQAMDVFVMPSFFEGIPVVGVEAQFANLSCVFSDKVPQEVKFNEKCEFNSLGKSAEEWVKTILEERTPNNRMTGHVIGSSYSIDNSKDILRNLYMELNKNND